MKFLLIALSVGLGCALVGVGLTLAESYPEIIDLRMKRHIPPRP